MAKTATFGLMHVATSFTITYALTGSVTVAGVVTFVEPVVNTVMHYFFDKYWDHPRAVAVRQAMTIKSAHRSIRGAQNENPGVGHTAGAS